MCTVTWLPTREGFELRMNRDELRTRAAALPPAIYERDGVRYIAPRDVDGGGTWITVNDAGVAVCLLNGTALPDGRVGSRSRGLLVEDFADARSVSEVRIRLADGGLSVYSPFTLLVLEPGDEVAQLFEHASVLGDEVREVVHATSFASASCSATTDSCAATASCG